MPPSSPPPPKRFHHFLPIATPTPAPELYTTLKTLISQNPSFPPEQKSIILALLSSPPSPTYTSTALLALLNTHGLGAAIHIIHQGLQFLRDGRRAYAPLPAPTTPATCLLTSHADSQQPLLRCEILPTSTRDRFRADCFWTLVRLFWEPELVAGLKEWCESAEAEECVENRIVLTQDAGAAFDRLDFVLEPVLGGAQVRWVGELHETLWACGGEGGKPGLVLNGAEVCSTFHLVCACRVYRGGRRGGRGG